MHGNCTHFPHVQMCEISHIHTFAHIFVIFSKQSLHILTQIFATFSAPARSHFIIELKP